MKKENEIQKRQVIISMTSFPKAIPYAIRTIQSLLDMSVLPDKLVLYLTFSQFENETIPEELRSLTRKNPIFEIRNYDKDIRSYRKLIPALSDFPESIIVTVDDDVLYHKDMLRSLLRLHSQIPHAVLAHRAKKIQLNKPYKKWKKYRWYDFLIKNIHKSYANLQTGVGGVLYPPHALKTEMLETDLFTKIAPTSDDIWFWAAGAANNFPVVPVPFGHNRPYGLHKPKELSLKTINFKSGNDINTSAIKRILEMYPDVRSKLNKSE